MIKTIKILTHLEEVYPLPRQTSECKNDKNSLRLHHLNVDIKFEANWTIAVDCRVQTRNL